MADIRSIDSFNIEGLAFGANGLIPAVVQEAATNEVLMVAYMSRESLQITLDEGYTCFYSRSRKELWRKGSVSGNRQRVVALASDCDNDTLLVTVATDGGPACHTGARSCFGAGQAVVAGQQPASGPASSAILEEVFRVVADRKANPVEGSYTTYLFTKGQDKILKKVGEECAEVLIASKNDSAEEIAYEMGDLLYHCMVLLANHGMTPGQVFQELARRRR